MSSVQFWCKQSAHYENYAHNVFSLGFNPPKSEQHARKAHYAQEGFITLTQTAHFGIGSPEKNDPTRTRTWNLSVKGASPSGIHSSN